MDKVNVIIISLLALIVLGMIHSYYNKPPPTTTTTKTVVVKQPVYGHPHGYHPHYNAYKAKYY